MHANWVGKTQFHVQVGDSVTLKGYVGAACCGSQRNETMTVWFDPSEQPFTLCTVIETSLSMRFHAATSVGLWGTASGDTHSASVWHPDLLFWIASAVNPGALQSKPFVGLHI